MTSLLPSFAPYAFYSLNFLPLQKAPISQFLSCNTFLSVSHALNFPTLIMSFLFIYLFPPSLQYLSCRTHISYHTVDSHFLYSYEPNHPSLLKLPLYDSELSKTKHTCSNCLNLEVYKECVVR